MSVPVVSSPAAVDSDSFDRERRELIASLRLLSGKECKRDPARAQAMLISLSESRDSRISEDAAAVLRAALARDWLERNSPRYSELEHIARLSLSASGTAATQARLVSLGLGVLMLLGLVVFFMYSSGMDLKQVLVAAALFVLALVVVMIWRVKR